jgi:predicted metal-binding membrane protein
VSTLEPGVLAAVRARLGLVVILIALAAGAWWSTIRSMHGMRGSPGTDLGALGWFVGIWIVMMAAMMLPAASPTVALYARMTRQGGLRRPLVFTSGFLVVWGATGIAAYGLFALGRHALGAELTWEGGGRWFAGGLLAAAAVYELTPLKDGCPGKCRSPFGSLTGAWRDGVRGAGAMGAEHAMWWLGCCWAQMVALFALGVMNVIWMAVIAALITVERLLPWRRVAVWSTTGLLLAFAIGVFAAPEAIPGFVVPSRSTMSGM